jgi:predicted metal-dependent hydrolase
MLLVSVCMLTAILLSAILMIIANPKKSAPEQDKPKPVAKNPFATGWIRYLFIKPGIVPYIMVPYFRYYSPFFHPWKHDNSELVERWKAHYANLRAASAPAQP